MNIEKGIKLSEMSSWKTGGRASLSLSVNSINDYKYAINICKSKSLTPLIVGNTTNLLFCDSDINAVLIKLGGAYDYVNIKNDLVEIGASSYAPFVARYLQKNGLSGLEHIVGIPATIGGLVYMNGGSLRKKISDNIVSVTSIDMCGNIIVRSKMECNFSYRHSIFNSTEELIISVTVRLNKANSNDIRKNCLNILKSRREKFPRKLPNCGSVFKSSPSLYETFGPPGKLIEDLGLKGQIIGGAKISNIHANFITNENLGLSSDILSLIFLIKDRVKEKHEIDIDTEVIYVDECGVLIDINELYNKVRCKSAG